MRIVIVEDEPRIREGLARLIGKIKPEYRVVGEARDGREGLRIVSELRPELVITDVRMPELGGLEMLDRLGEESVKVKAIVLSAYSEFSYAREAIKLGVSEYLLKPVNIGELKRSLERVEARIEDEKLSRLTEGSAALEGALYSIMLGGAKVDAGLRATLASECRVDTEGRFALAAVYLGRRYEKDAPRVIELARATLAKGPGPEWRIIESPRNDRFFVVAFNFENIESVLDWFGSVFIARMNEAGIPELCAGWEGCDDLDGLKGAVPGIDQCLEWSISLGGRSLLVWPEVERTAVIPLPYPRAAESEIRAAFCAADRKRYEKGIAEFMSRLCDGPVHSPKEIKDCLVRLAWSVLNTAREIAREDGAALARQDLLERIKQALSWNELEESAAALSGLIEGKAEGAANDCLIVARAKSVAKEYYSQGITLNEVAAQIDVTPEYLSAQFHRETGTTFSSFIRDFRMQKAKELLMSTDLKLHDVGEQAGYRDSKYFCRVFKEVTGQSPSEYRRANR